MAKKFSILGALFICLLLDANARKTSEDSTQVAKAFSELTSLCKSVDFTDPKVTSIGFFYKAAPYIVYRGSDAKRAWKDFANYSNPEEKQGVDGVCERINRTVNQSNEVQIVAYSTETEREGTWHVLQVQYTVKGAQKKSAFAFLKIKGRFALGDID